MLGVEEPEVPSWPPPVLLIRSLALIAVVPAPVGVTMSKAYWLALLEIRLKSMAGKVEVAPVEVRLVTVPLVSNEGVVAVELAVVA